MSAVFILFIVMGVVSMRNAKLFEKKAESENSLVDTLLKWSEENLTAEKSTRRSKMQQILPKKPCIIRDLKSSATR